MVKMMILVAMMTGCMYGDNEAGPETYTCVLLYRCEGAEVMNARLALPCAGDEYEAEDKAMESAITAADEGCGEGQWMSVQARCERYEPGEACEP